MPVRRGALGALVVGLLFATLAACTSSGQVPAPTATVVIGPGALFDAPKNAAGYVDISPQQLADLLQHKSFTLVNVHVPYQGEIAQTDLFIPYDKIASSLKELPEKNSPIVLYCRSGNMSTIAATKLAQLGYTNVAQLKGGFDAWKAAGYEVLVRPH